MNTGAEAVETAIKASRRWGYFSKGIEENKAEIIVANGNFHGRTTTIVGFSSDPEYKKGFGPFSEGFVEADYCNTNCDCSRVCEKSIDSIKNLINENTCAVIVEPIQGEGGIITPQKGWLVQLRKLCTDNNVLLILDEIQSAASVASKALDLIYEDNLISNSKEMGIYLSNQIRDLNLEIIKDVRGKGLWIGVELDPKVSAKKVCLALMDEGILAKETHATVIRFAPPLIITKEEIDWAMERIKKVLNNFAE